MPFNPKTLRAISVGLLFTGALCVAQQTISKKKAAPDAKQPATKQAIKPPAKAGNAEEARAQFDRVYGEWKELMAGLADLQNKYQNAAEKDKPTIEEQYNAEARQGEKLAQRLKTATEAAFAADPSDKEVAQLLNLILRTAVYEDNHEEVDRFARLFLDHKVNEAQVAWLAANAAMGLHKFENVEPLLQKAKMALDDDGKALIAAAKKYIELWPREQKIRQQEAEADDLPRVKLTTTKGDIVLELFENQAPNTVANFISLVEKKYYDGVLFHRVIGATRREDGVMMPGFMAQGGDPKGTGGGGPGYRIKDEAGRADARMHFTGSLSMAKTAAPDSGGSQFFLTFRPTSHLNGLHTVFGRVIEGLDVLGKLNRVQPDPKTGEPPAGADKILKATVLRKRDHAYKPETLKEE